MAKVEFHPILMQMRGRVHNLIFRLSHSGKPAVYAAPDMSGIRWSQAQKQQRVRFKTANRYAQRAMEIPELHAYYLEMAAKRNSKQPYNMAVADYSKGDDTHNTLLKLYRQHEGADFIWLPEKLQFPSTMHPAPDDFCI